MKVYVLVVSDKWERGWPETVEVHTSWHEAKEKRERIYKKDLGKRCFIYERKVRGA